MSWGPRRATSGRSRSNNSHRVPPSQPVAPALGSVRGDGMQDWQAQEDLLHRQQRMIQQEHLLFQQQFKQQFPQESLTRPSSRAMQHVQHIQHQQPRQQQRQQQPKPRLAPASLHQQPQPQQPRRSVSFRQAPQQQQRQLRDRAIHAAGFEPDMVRRSAAMYRGRVPSGPSEDEEDDVDKNFKVCVRIRPPLPREVNNRNSSYSEVVSVSPNHREVMISETMTNSSSNHNNNQWSGNGNAVPLTSAHRFTFDYVYDQDSRQTEVYKHSAKKLVLNVLEGYNATVLAYGQTGTGKTFTMEGFDDTELRGIIPRAVEEIFSYIQNTAHTDARFLVRASYLQIYNEVISDLLKPERSNLQIREDKKKGVFVEGLSEWVVRSPREVYGLIKRGSAIRATGSTRMNEVSSRSHSVFVIIVEQNDGSGNPKRQHFKVGKLNLVDLAGSERVRISGASGRRLEESKKINQSLSALGNVIAALTDRGGTRSHIPYRDSKLTRLLEDSLGGNCKTTFMAMVSPALESFMESLSTLKFANRAKNIKNEARVNEDLDEKALLRRYERELKKLRHELATRSRNVVDKRKLIELEEKRRQAEQDKMAALMNMEQLSCELMQEKSNKQRLEDKIKELSSKLLVGGHEMKDTAAFQRALQEEQDRIRDEYEAKISELEAERKSMEEEKVQTHRYKQLLLKQRDIMIQLTERLNERDRSILALREELEAYDSHQRMMEDALDQKTATLIHLQKGMMESGGDRTQSRQQQQQQQHQKAVAEAESLRAQLAAAQDQQAQLARAQEQRQEEQRGVHERLANGLREAQEENRRLREQLQAQIQQTGSAPPDDALRDLQRKHAVQMKERTALKVILERKMKTLVDSISAATGALSSSSTALPARTLREVEVLKKLVDASVVALKHSDAEAAAADADDARAGVRHATRPLHATAPTSQRRSA